MFSKDFKDNIIHKVNIINKLIYAEDRLKQIIALREEIYTNLNDEIDDFLSKINLKKTELENE